MKDRFHQRTGHGGAGVQRRDGVASIVLDGAEPRVACDTAVELVRSIGVEVNPVQNNTREHRDQSDLQALGWRWGIERRCVSCSCCRLALRRRGSPSRLLKYPTLKPPPSVQ